MNLRNRAFARTSAACAAVALAISGCSAAGTGSGSSAITASGHTLTIYLSQPSDLKANPVATDIYDAEQLAFSQNSSEVTAYKLRVQGLAAGKPSDHARFAIQDKSSIAYIGEVPPGTSEQSVGITNAVDLLQVSPTDTALELGQGSAVISGAPQKYFESWSSYGRTFARVVPTSAQEAAFLVQRMLAMHVTNLFVASDTSDYGQALANQIKLLAQHAGLKTSSTESGADAIFYGTDSPAAGAKFFNTAASTASSAKLFGSSSLDNPSFLSALSGSASNVYVSTPGLPTGQLPAAGKAFRQAFATKYGHQPSGQAIFGYVAMSALLDVLKQAGKKANDRATVVKEFLGLHNYASALGTFSMNTAGNTSLDTFVLNRVRAGKLLPAG